MKKDTFHKVFAPLRLDQDNIYLRELNTRLPREPTKEDFFMFFYVL